MADQIMRTQVFGGFKKEDVLSYVEQLQKQIEEFKKDLDDKQNKIVELSGEVSRLSSECEQISELKTELEEKNAMLSQAEEENVDLKVQLASLTEVKDEYESAKQQLADSNKAIDDAKAQLGAAFLDARKYSDEIVAAANEQAHKASKSFSEDITKQANEISRLSNELDSLSASFTRSVTELHNNIALLAQKMSATAQNLGIKKDATFKPNFNVDFAIDDDASGVIETNDGSGLTFIQYPPKTEFNEDLNIQPDLSFKLSGEEEQA
ncbi:MAG: hypothetical protein IJK26_04865 [Clostridia bacterium]|nr:hypothetical protein [Clostridia bacterium]